MFNYAEKFNGDISNWDVSNVTDMSYLFSDSIFNSNISTWDVQNVISMSRMFSHPNFNKDILNFYFTYDNPVNIIDFLDSAKDDYPEYFI
jgi:surface protein